MPMATESMWLAERSCKWWYRRQFLCRCSLNWNIIKQIWYGGKRSGFQIWQIIVTKMRKLSSIGR